MESSFRSALMNDELCHNVHILDFFAISLVCPRRFNRERQESAFWCSTSPAELFRPVTDSVGQQDRTVQDSTESEDSRTVQGSTGSGGQQDTRTVQDSAG
jgi:hypothetical protein